MAKHNDQVFRRVVTEGLRKQHSTGIAQGAYAISKVILDKATDEKKTPEERLESVIAFCKTCTKLKDDPPAEGDKK